MADFRKFACSYRMADGSEWGFYIFANDADDAEKRLRQIRFNGNVDGQVIVEGRLPSVISRIIQQLIDRGSSE